MSFVTPYTPAFWSYTSSWIHWNSEKLISDSVLCADPLLWIFLYQACVPCMGPGAIMRAQEQEQSCHSVQPQALPAISAWPKHPSGTLLWVRSAHQEFCEGRGRGWFQL